MRDQTAGTTADRVLDAALAGLAEHGLARLSLGEVAASAGVSRQTIYRHFGSRTGLLEAVILREEAAFIAAIVAAAQPHGDVRAAMAAAVRTALDSARAHPLLDRLLAEEPEALVPYLTTRGTPVLDAAAPTLTTLLRDRLPGTADAVVRRTADVLTRLVISYTLNPPACDSAALAEEVADLLTEGLAS